MVKRGRPSKNDLASTPQVVAVDFSKRPPAPEILTDEEALIWDITVNSEAADYFTTAATKAMLSDYCRHRAAVEKITEIINLFKVEWLKDAKGISRYKELLKVRDGEARAAADKATKLRMTNQSRYTPMAAATASRNTSKNLKPWEM